MFKFSTAKRFCIILWLKLRYIDKKSILGVLIHFNETAMQISVDLISKWEKKQSCISIAYFQWKTWKKCVNKLMHQHTIDIEHESKYQNKTNGAIFRRLTFLHLVKNVMIYCGWKGGQSVDFILIPAHLVSKWKIIYFEVS